MKDYSSLHPSELYGLCEVLVELYDRISPKDVMTVGAAARDLIHRDFGHNFKLRSTTDIDVAVILAEKDAYKQLTDAYATTGNSGIRFIVADQEVDIVPFGGIENPTGTSYPISTNHGIDVYGFSEVYDAAEEYLLPGNLVANLPSPQGYCATKIKAWIDRSPDGEYKDAGDMSYICYWYQQSTDIFNSLYKVNLPFLEIADYDANTASMYLLGSQVNALLGAELSAGLKRMWDKDSRRKMAWSETFDTTLGSDPNRNPDHRLRNYDAIHSRL